MMINLELSLDLFGPLLAQSYLTIKLWHCHYLLLQLSHLSQKYNFPIPLLSIHSLNYVCNQYLFSTYSVPRIVHVTVEANKHGLCLHGIYGLISVLRVANLCIAFNPKSFTFEVLCLNLSIYLLSKNYSFALFV